MPVPGRVTFRILNEYEILLFSNPAFRLTSCLPLGLGLSIDTYHGECCEE